MLSGFVYKKKNAPLGPGRRAGSIGQVTDLEVARPGGGGARPVRGERPGAPGAPLGQCGLRACKEWPGHRRGRQWVGGSRGGVPFTCARQGCVPHSGLRGQPRAPSGGLRPRSTPSPLPAASSRPPWGSGYALGGESTVGEGPPDREPGRQGGRRPHLRPPLPCRDVQG